MSPPSTDQCPVMTADHQHSLSLTPRKTKKHRDTEALATRHSLLLTPSHLLPHEAHLDRCHWHFGATSRCCPGGTKGPHYRRRNDRESSQSHWPCTRNPACGTQDEASEPESGRGGLSEGCGHCSSVDRIRPASSWHRKPTKPFKKGSFYRNQYNVSFLTTRWSNFNSCMHACLTMIPGSARHVKTWVS